MASVMDSSTDTELGSIYKSSSAENFENKPAFKFSADGNDEGSAGATAESDISKDQIQNADVENPLTKGTVTASDNVEEKEKNAEEEPEEGELVELFAIQLPGLKAFNSSVR